MHITLKLYSDRILLFYKIMHYLTKMPQGIKQLTENLKNKILNFKYELTLCNKLFKT